MELALLAIVTGGAKNQWKDRNLLAEVQVRFQLLYPRGCVLVEEAKSSMLGTSAQLAKS